MLQLPDKGDEERFVLAGQIISILKEFVQAHGKSDRPVSPSVNDALATLFRLPRRYKGSKNSGLKSVWGIYWDLGETSDKEYEEKEEKKTLFETVRGYIRFRELHLKGANLYDAYLRWIDLRGVDLREANLAKANLQYTSLLNADLRHARLEGVSTNRPHLVRVNDGDEGQGNHALEG